MSSPLQSITDDLLIDAISKASSRIVFVAPAVWPPIAKALSKAWHRLGSERVSIILDVDAEVCRLGYGSIEGLQELQSTATGLNQAIGHESGVRICVLIADGQTFVFSPTPQLIESPPGETEDKPTTTKPRTNGIVLDSAPPALKDQLGIGASSHATLGIGLDPVVADKVAAVAKDLEDNPPKPFDLTRAVNVYNARIQFVELKVVGCRLSQHKAALPKYLLHVVRQNKELAKKIENSIQLLDSDDALVKDPKLSQDTVFKIRDGIDAKYLHAVKGIGTLIARERKPDFLKDVKALQAEVEKYAERVGGILADRFQQTAALLAKELLGDVVADIPEAWKKRLGSRPDPEEVGWRIKDDLLRAFGDPDRKVGRMTVETVFKDVTYDMLKDPNFAEVIAEHFEGLPIMEESVAAKQRKSTQAPFHFD